MSASKISPYVSLFTRIGLKHGKAIETAKNPSICKRLEYIIGKTETEILKSEVDSERGILLYLLSSYSLNDQQLTLVLGMICERKITSGAQINAAAEYFKRNIQKDIDIPALERACGIGVTYDDAEVEAVISSVLKRLNITENDYSKVNKGPIIGAIVKDFKWLDIEKLNKMIEKQISSLPLNLKIVQKVETKSGFTDWKSVLASIDPKQIYTCGEASKFHRPGENYTSPNYVVTENTERLMAEHLKKYGNQVRTRFPPEPNGILHIGHAKAINFNFGYAKASDGITYLRYDDTNPEKEEEKFFHGIVDAIIWLGFSPHQITHSSDNFDILYTFAQKLIKKGLAYVCHQTFDLVKGRNAPTSPWRDRPIDESLRLFKDMKDGMFQEGEATLRLKYVMEDGKQDPVAYRILFTPHHRTGSKWCIYPTYSYSHPICDSVEGITHSLCTKEFQNQRSFYFWLCNSLEIYCPVQWEYSRLNLNYSVMSKRKIIKLIEEKVVNDWDDPRLFTLNALRRRGVPPEAINYFCSKVGVTMASNTISPTLFYSCIREVLNIKAKRVMALLEPISVTIVNFDDVLNVSVSDFPFDPSLGTRKLTFGNKIFIDSSDFDIKNCDPDFRRLTPTQSVGLMHVGKVLTLVEIIKKSNCVDELVCKIEDLTQTNRPRAFIQWVHDGLKCETRIYNELFQHADPDSVEGGFLKDINQNSMVVYKNSLVEKTAKNAKILSNFQFERIGYFCIDIESNNEKMVFNRTVQLK